MGSLLIDVTIKGTLVLLATCAAAHALRGGSAATRHVIWTVGLTGALALPILSKLLPVWSVDLLPVQALSAPVVAAPPAAGGVGFDALLALAWLAGATVVLSSIVLGRFRIWWIARRSFPLDRGELPALTTALCGALGISRRVTVRLSPERVMPMVWGAVRPVILLPAEATEWSADLQRDVLLHELAHVRRHDYLNQLVCRFACAVHWFNPLAWIAARRLRAERERACDDHVLGTGASACDYAEHLVAVARRMRPAGRGTLGVAMAGRSAFGERVAALLDGRRARGILTGGLLARFGLGAACLVFPLAALQPGRDAGPILVPPGRIVGPPPSANAEAAGALPTAAEAPRNRTERPEAVRTPRPAPTKESGPRAERVTRPTVVLLQAPAVRAVFRTVGSGPAAEIVVVPDAGGPSGECTDSHAAPGNATSATEPDLVWVPSGGSTP